MGVKRETVNTFAWSGSVHPCRLVRQASGGWTVVINVAAVITLRDGREIHVHKHVRTKANEQRGRKRAALGKGDKHA